MKTNKAAIIVTILISLFDFWACGPSKTIDETTTRGNIKISADESYTLMMDSQVSTFEMLYTYAIIKPQYKNEVDCINDLLNDSVRMIVINRQLTPTEDNALRSQKILPKTTKIALDGLAFIVNKNNADSNFTYDNIRGIFMGEISKWNQIDNKSNLGGISVVFDNNKSGNPRYFKEKFKLTGNFPSYCYAVNSNTEVINYVEKNKDAIGIVSVNWISDADDSVSNSFLKRVKVAGVSAENTDGPFLKPYLGYLVEGSYPFIREVYAINREYFSGLGTGFVQFIAGDKGQLIIKRSGLAPATMPIRLVHIKK